MGLTEDFRNQTAPGASEGIHAGTVAGSVVLRIACPITDDNIG